MSTQTPVRPDDARQGTSLPGRRPPGAGTILLGLVLIGAGGVWLLAALGLELPVAVVTPVVLIALGLAVTVSAFRGEDSAAIGLAVFIGVWVAIAALVTSAVDVPLTGAVGDRDHAPTVAADLAEDYRLFAGSQVLDLRDLELTEGTTEVELSTVLGEIEVVVPEGTEVRVDAAVTAGSITILDEAVDGVGVRRTEETDGWADATRRLDVRVRVGLGEVRVRSS